MGGLHCALLSNFLPLRYNTACCDLEWWIRKHISYIHVSTGVSSTYLGICRGGKWWSHLKNSSSVILCYICTIFTAHKQHLFVCNILEFIPTQTLLCRYNSTKINWWNTCIMKILRLANEFTTRLESQTGVVYYVVVTELYCIWSGFVPTFFVTPKLTWLLD